MRWRLLNALAIISFVLCLLICAAWARSYWQRTFLSHTIMPQEGGLWRWDTKALSVQNGMCVWTRRTYLVTSSRFQEIWDQKPGRWLMRQLPSDPIRTTFSRALWFSFQWKLEPATKQPFAVKYAIS